MPETTSTQSSSDTTTGKVGSGPMVKDREWATPGAPASRRVLAIVGGAALVAAAVVPVDRVGVGWAVAAGAVVVAVVVLGRGGVVRWGWLALGLALMATSAVRAAPWLFALCHLGAVVCLSLSVTGGSVTGGSVAGGRSLRGLAVGAGAVLTAGVRAVPWLVSGAWVAARSRRGGPRIGRSLVIGAGLLALFGSLFAAADAAFAELVEDVAPDITGVAAGPGLVVFGVAALLVGGVAFLREAPLPADRAPTAWPRVALVEWALPVAVLVALFAVFIGVQVAALFGGDAHVARTAELTYAVYARSGFWQLLVVTALTLAVIAVTARVAPTGTVLERVWLRGLLGALTVATLVIVASALGRLWLYQQTYGFTVLRLLVGVAELWLGVVCLMILAAGRRLRAGLLPRAVLGSGLGVLLGLAVLSPEGFVAEWNVQRHAETGRVDADYLAGLSADAVPALAGLPDPVRGDVLAEHAARMTGDGPAEWNWGRARARAILAAREFTG
ncbi:DUF4153 domain-containing protein [Actinokineospora sp. 24-640]